MDAAQLIRKTALYLTAALLLAGAVSAQTLTVSTNTVVFNQFTNSVPITVTTSSADLQFTVGVHSNWYTPAQGTTFIGSQTINVTRVLGNCLQLGTCNDSFDLIPGGNPGGKVTISVSVDTSSTPATNLTASQNPVNIPVSFGGAASTTTNISTGSGTAVGVTITQTPAAGSWLTVFPSTGTVVSGTPLALSVFANASGYSNNQTLTGTITVTPNNGGQPLNITVNMVIGSGSVVGSLTPNPTSVSLAYPTGNTGQAVLVTSNTAGSFNATANSSNGWLLVNGGYSVSSVSTGSNIVLSLNTSAAALLGAGTYSGTVTLTNVINGADVTQIPVTLSVYGGGGGTTTGQAAPSSLTFAHQQFGPAPPCQQVLVPYTGTFQVSPSGSPLFLYTSGAEITAPGTVLVCAAVANLTPGVYTNALNLVSSTLGISQSISVTLNVYSSPVVLVSANSPTATDNGVISCFFQTGVRGCNDSTLNIRMSDNSNTAFTVTSAASWVTVDSASGTTPGTLTVRLTPGTLSNGVNTATINIAATGAANGSVNVPVVVQVNGGTSGGGGNLTFSASSLSFTAAGTQTLSVSAASATSFTASTPSSGCSWLSISPSGALTTPQNIAVTVSSSGLNAGTTYSCNISFVASGTTQTVGVSFTVPAGPTGNVTVDKTSLSFTTTTGTNPPSQTIAVSSVTGPVAFTVSTQSSGWLSVTPVSATTPFTVNVNVNASSLANGAHSGQILITPNGGQTVQVSVALTVSPPTAVSATPATLSFSYIAGNANPAAQQISVTGTGSNLGFTASVTTGNEWLSVTPASGTTPNTLDVRVSPGNLNPGTYSGTIVVAGSGGATGSTTITVSLTVTAPLPTISRVTNGASFNTGPISAGEIITLFGIAMGPGTIQVASPSGGLFPTTLGGVQVLVGGYPAPLIYVRGDQIAAVVPYEINRPFIANPTIVVRYLGQTSNGITLSQVGAMPGLFTAGGGTGQGAILNSNLSVNSAANPAAKGDVVVLYVTGEGVTNPAGVTGRITPSTTPYPQPVSGVVTVTIDGQPATVTFYGEAPGLIAGVMQVNVIVPQGAGSGSVPVVVRVGDASSQLDSNGRGAVTVAVR